MTSFNRKKSAPFSIAVMNKMIQSGFIRKKHLVVFLLEYIRDYGAREFLLSAFLTVKDGGLQSIFSPRKTLLHKIKNRGAGKLLSMTPLIPADNLNALAASQHHFVSRPLISVILPVYNPKPALLQAAINSVKKQVYANWELCIADDCSTNPMISKILEGYASDNRIKYIRLKKNSGISEASNTAIALSTGAYIALLDHDDEFTPAALYWIVHEINKVGETDILYSDECKMDEKGVLSDYFFKPDWSPELLFNMMYTGHLTVYRKVFLLNQVGLFRSTFDFSQDYDLMLRASEKTHRIRHIKKILYHWRITAGSAAGGDKPFARKTNIAALQEAVRRRTIDASVVELPTANRVLMKPDITTGVSIIIPTDSYENLKEAIHALLANTDYPLWEIVVVTNTGLAQQMKHHFQVTNIVYVLYNQPYNFSDKCNQGAANASYGTLIFFNDDVRPLEKDWLKNCVEYLALPGIGAVSPKLVYENDTIQYAGMATGMRNFIGTTFHGYQKDSVAYHNFPQLVRNVSILSGACLAIKKETFNQVGGFDAINTPSAHSDLDLSFKLLEHGYRNLYTPYATLRHIGHLSLKELDKKNIDKKDKADIFILKRWMKYLPEDPYFTFPMRNFLYHDSPQPYQLFGNTAPQGASDNGNIMLVSHDLSSSGAPLNLFDLAKILLRNGYFVTVCAPADGALRKMYVQEKIPVIIDSLIFSAVDTFRQFARNFDCIICNTIVTWPVVQQMQPSVPVIWWLQEAGAINTFVQNRACEQTLAGASTVVGLSDYALSFIRKYNPAAVKIYNTCFDMYQGTRNTSDKINGNAKTIITLIGSIEQRKGQDIVIDALNLLDDHFLKRIELHFVGRYQDPHFTKKLKRLTANKSFVHFTGEVTREQSLQYIRESDILLNASRDEPLSVALVEGCCLGKPCIVSDQTGLAELVTEGVDGFIFVHEDAADLAKKISTAITNPEKLPEMGLAARKIYENFLSVELFEKKFLDLIHLKSTQAGYEGTAA